MITKFPPHETADSQGLIAVGGDVEPESLILAYTNGIFPWPILGDDTIAWFSPPERALLFLNNLKISKSLRKLNSRSVFNFKVNQDFPKVIRNCAYSQNRKDQLGTWITEEIIQGYIELHKKGYAHSVECYLKEDLVGGLYGVSFGGMFAGESMFYLESGASKLSFLFLVEFLEKQGLKWLDCQQMTPLFESFGAELVKRDVYLELLGEALSKPCLKF